jgi:hypothetical protein
MAREPTGADMVTRAFALVTGLGGAATLVTLTGGAIIWVRFDRAEMPADQAVAATPREELVTAGAVALLGFGVIALLAVLVVYLLDRCGTPGPRNQAGIGVLALLAVAAAVLLSEPPAARLAGALAVAALSTLVIPVLARRALKRWRADADDGRADTVPARVGVIVVALTVPAAAALWGLTGERWVGGLALAVAALAAGLLAVARATGDRFRWFGVAVFLGVLVFGALMSTLRTAEATKLQSIAVLLTDAAGGQGISGLYVTETSERVYVADVDHCRRHDLVLRPTDRPVPGTGRIVEVPRASVQSMAIGVRERLRRAEARGPHLLTELRTRAASGSLPQRPTLGTPHPCADEGVVDLTARAFTEPDAATAAADAARFRPILRFDSGERWRPLNIDRLLAERSPAGAPRHRLCAIHGGRQGPCEPLAGVADLADDRSAARVIDFAGRALEGTDQRSPTLERCPGAQPARLYDCDRGPATAMYYRVTRSGGRTYVDYWWYLRFNDFASPRIRALCRNAVQRGLFGCYNHEGDWEGVTVVSARRDPTRLAFVDMASHEGVFRFAAAEVRRRGARPIVYPARGSHAAYSRPCAKGCRQHYSRLPETSHDGRAPWGANGAADCPPGTCLIPLPAREFDAFPGRWGSPECDGGGCRLVPGPRSPSRQRRYERPWCFTGTDGRLACDGTPPRS